MNTKTSVVFSIIAIAAAVLLFAAGPVVATHQVWAWGGGRMGRRRLLRLLQLLRRLRRMGRRLRRLVNSTANKHQKLKGMVEKTTQSLFIFICMARQDEDKKYCAAERLRPMTSRINLIDSLL